MSDSPRPATVGSIVRQVSIFIALVTVYFLGGKLGLSLAFEHPSATPVWPPTGIALAAMLLLGVRVWPAVFVGAFLANWTTAGTPATSAVIAIGNTLEAVVGALLVRRFAGGRNAFDRAVDIVRFALLAAVFSTMISATIGVATLRLGGLIPDGAPIAPVWLTWWLGDASSNLIVAPAILLLASPLRASIGRPRVVESALVLLVVGLVGQFVFGGWSPRAWRNLPLEYLGLLPLIWAAFRCGRRVAALLALLMSALAVVGTLRGAGPFAAFEPNRSLLLLQAFMTTVALTALILAAVVDERRRIHDALARAGDAARAANAAKDRFIAILSHELRTPLTPALASLTMLQQDASLAPSTRDELSMIRRNIETEARLIDDLLDLNRLTLGKLELRNQLVDVREVVRRAIEICNVPTDAPRPTIRIAMHLDAANHHVRGDPARLAQVCWNLFNNAIKFMPADGGTVTLRSSNPSSGTLALQFTDTGIGIAPEELARLFRPFEQAARREVPRGGLGLGLVISRSLIEAHGGHLTAASDGVGRGATFTIELPTTTPPSRITIAPAGDGAQDGSSSTPAASVRVLLVEDHADTARALCRLLRMQGHDVTLATTVAQAMELASQGRFDVLVSDLGLPDGTGLELMRDLKSRFGLPGVALSGYGMEQDLVRAREAGFAEHLVKPIDLQRLAEVITRLTAPAG